MKIDAGINKRSVVVINGEVEILHLKTKKGKILLIKKKPKSNFIETNEPKTKQYRKIIKKTSQAVTNKKFHQVNPEDWRPKHIVQYLKNKYEIIYNTIPLDLQWDEKGYTKQAKDRAKNWAYAKHLLDKFDRLKISRKRVRHYIDWCFDEKNIVPTMSLLSCNNWIDSYNIEFRNKRIRQTKVMEVVKQRTEIWRDQTK